MYTHEEVGQLVARIKELKSQALQNAVTCDEESLSNLLEEAIALGQAEVYLQAVLVRALRRAKQN